MDSGTAASPASTVCDRGPASTVMRKWNRSTPWGAAPNSTGNSKKRDWARSVSRCFACLRGRDWESTETSTLRPARPPERSKWTRNRTQSLYARPTSGTIPSGGREGAVRTVFPTVYRKALNNWSFAIYPDCVRHSPGRRIAGNVCVQTPASVPPRLHARRVGCVSVSWRWQAVPAGPSLPLMCRGVRRYFTCLDFFLGDGGP
jgi:hypothetical protein